MCSAVLNFAVSSEMAYVTCNIELYVMSATSLETYSEVDYVKNYKLKMFEV